MARLIAAAARLRSAGTAKKMQRRDIQGLRALAVLAVVANHLTEWPSGAFVGVDVFFVISGYLITALLLREHAKTGTISARKFYVRRIRRVVPAAVLVVFCTYSVGSFVVYEPATQGRELGGDALWALAFAANWRFLGQGTDYFQQGQLPSPLLHYWSLSVEEQFYLVWPWVLLLVLAIGSRRLNWGLRAKAVAATALILTITGASYWFALGESASAPTGAYFSSLTRAWELGIGALVATTAGLWRRLPVLFRPALAWVGFGVILASLFMVTEDAGFPAPWALMPVLGTALVIAAGEGTERQRIFPLTNRVSGFIGDISYSLYLWHFPVAILLLAYLPGDSITYYVVAGTLMAALSIASFYMLEEPIRRSSWLERRGDPVYSDRSKALAVVALATWLGIISGVAYANFAEQDPTPPNLQAASRAPGPQMPCLGAIAVYAKGDCAPLPDPLAIYPRDIEADSRGLYQCFPAAGQPMQACRVGESGSGLRVALVGDSHAAALQTGLRVQASDRGWQLTTLMGQDCIWGSPGNCPALADITEELHSGNFDVIVTSSSRKTIQTSAPEAAADMAAAWRPAIEAGAKILAVEDVPLVSDLAYECELRKSVRPDDEDCRTPLEAAFAIQDPIPLAVELSPARGARLFSLSEVLCDAVSCPTIIGNVRVYADTNPHLTDTFSETLGPLIADAVEALGKGRREG